MAIKISLAMQLAESAAILIARGVFLTLWLILHAADAILKHLADGTAHPGSENYLTHTNPFWHWHVPPPRLP